MKKILIILLIISSKQGFSQFLSASGSWYPTVPASLITDAGLNYDREYALQSEINQTLLNLSYRAETKTNNWQILVNRSDINWNPSLKLAIKRTSNGTGPKISTVTGGTFFQEIEQSNNLFFTGSEDFTNIAIQYQLTGLSVLIPVDSYATSVVFTIMEF